MQTQGTVRRSSALVAATALLVLAGCVGWGAEAVRVGVEIANTADPNLLGAIVYEFSAVVFMKDTSSISVRSFFPFLVVAPGETRQLGPFELQDIPTTLILLGRKGPPGPAMESLAVTVSPLSSGVIHEEGTLRITVRFGEEAREEPVVLMGYLFSVRQFWCTRSEGPLCLLQTGEFGVGLDGFYVVVGAPRWPWLEDPLLEPHVGKNVQVRGRLIPAGEEVPISEDRSATYPLPALVVGEIREVEPPERCLF